MINILVIGKNGQLGNCIKEEAALLCDVNLQISYKGREELDITSFEQINKALDVIHYDYVINCSAYTDVAKAETDIDNANNVNGIGVKYLAELCEHYNTRLIHISTDFVFDSTCNVKYESSDIHPLNQYGLSKALGEDYIKQVENAHPNFEYMIIRTSWLYSKYGKNFVKTMYHKILKGEKFNVVCDQVGSPTCANNLARCILEIIQKCSKNYSFIGGVYHYSDDGIISRYDFAKAIEEFIDNGSNIVQPCFTIGADVRRPAYVVWSKNQLAVHYDIKFNYWKSSLFRTLCKIV